MKKLTLAIISTFIFSTTIMAQIPQTMSFQGSLVDPTTGDPKSDGSYDISFAIWDDPTLGIGNNLWLENHIGVPVQNGLFNVVLGSQEADLSTVLFDKPLWLEINVQGETLNPRIELTASAYSLSAASVSGETNRFPSTGKVGIGTENPDYDLHIVGESPNADTFLGLSSSDEAHRMLLMPGRQNFPNAMISWTPANPLLFLQWDDAIWNEVMRISPSGNVGIGTIDPQRKIDLVGDVRANGKLISQGEAGGQIMLGNPGIDVTSQANTFVTDVLDGYQRFYSVDGSGIATHSLSLSQNGNVGVQNGNPQSALHISGTVTATTFIGDGSGLTNIGGLTGLTNTSITAFGVSSGVSNTSGILNAFFGEFSGFSNSEGSNNSFFGDNAGYSNTTGSGNSYFGQNAGIANNGSNNAFFGVQAGASSTGANNSYFGATAGLNNIGSGNVFLGFQSGEGETAADNKLFIENSNSSLPLIYGEFDNDLVRINGSFDVTGSITGDGSGITNLSGNALDNGNSNLFIGPSAGSNTTGGANTFLGSEAGLANTSGGGNTFIGSGAGQDNTTTGNNTFVGQWAGHVNTTGQNNTFLGGGAGENNTTVSDNTFIGAWAGQMNTTGSYNTFLGTSAGATNNTGNENTYLGFNSGVVNTSNANTFIGAYSGGLTTSGGGNTFFGYQSGNENTIGSNNILIGNSAGSPISGGYLGNSLTTESENILIGIGTGFDPATSGFTNSVAIGNGATVGASDVIVLGNGNQNVGIGTTTPSVRLSLKANQPDGEVIIFKNEDDQSAADVLRISINNAGNPATSNNFITFVSGGTFIGAIEGDNVGGLQFPAISDRRLKQNISDLSGALAIINNIQPRTYEFKTAPGKTRNGFIAQELLEVYPQVVSGNPKSDLKTEPMMVDYSKLTPLLTAAIQEQQDIIENQQKQIDDLKEQLEQLTRAVEAVSNTELTSKK